MSILLKQSLQETIYSQMEATFPNEGGGFLLGTPSGEDVQIIDVIAVENVFETEEQ